jgi:hypothetical protein
MEAGAVDHDVAHGRNLLDAGFGQRSVAHLPYTVLT